MPTPKGGPLSKPEKALKRQLDSLGPVPEEALARRADAVIAAHALLERLGFENYDIDELLGVAEFLTRED